MSQFKEFKENHFRPGLFIFSVILSTVMIIAAKWQWTRYHEKLLLVKTFKSNTEHNSVVLSADDLSKGNIKDLVNKKIQIKGEFNFENQLIIGNRRSEFGAGSWILTPFKIDNSDESILVSRGFIPYEDRDKESWAKYTPKEFSNTEVEIQGVLYQTTGKRSSFSPEAKTDHPNIFLYPDIDLISEGYPIKIYKGFFLQGIMEPVFNKFPMTDVKIDVPPSTHFWYTFEWIILAIMTQIVVFLIQLFRPIRKQSPLVK